MQIVNILALSTIRPLSFFPDDRYNKAGLFSGAEIRNACRL